MAVRAGRGRAIGLTVPKKVVSETDGTVDSHYSVVPSIEGLSSRFIQERSEGLRARFRVRVGNACRDVVVDRDSCRVERARGRPDTEIKTSPQTWRDMDEGRLSGIEAFAQGKLSLRGSIQKSLLFEPLFERPDAGALRFDITDIRIRKTRISTLITGPKDAPPLVLLHGLGASKASWLPVVPQLANHYRILAVDLPGFGASSKPRGRYDARWFAEQMFGFLDSAGYESAMIAGNSMGGRIAQEMAMLHPDRIDAIACLCPATAFSRRPGLWLARLLRPELGSALAIMPRGQLKSTIRALFARPGRIDDSWYEAALDDFLATWKSPRARMAFFAAARHIYMEEPNGEKGFWSRLSLMGTPAFYVYGRHDSLITHHFGNKVSRFVPSAQVEIWDDCGHVPQLEHPDRTANCLLDFFDDVQASAEAL
ncbi:MAG: hypothetical protein QOH26_2097 [Actinomycetota bacterium]|jgi:pimeloyl-ACP methyl ester carboxylesterase/putative sterol carrier protein|nr:hypothetical protein [Actinomycetota bacterium]